jgi:hypothetical protein
LNKIISILSITLILSIVSISGCTDSSTGNKTFSDGAMSFNYPSSFNSYSDDTNSSFYESIANFADYDHHIRLSVFKNKTEITLTEAKAASISKVKNYTKDEVLSVTTETNPNGIVVERYTFIDRTNPTSISNVMLFKISNNIYVIGVDGPESIKKKVTDTTNIVFQSIK